ncbi:MAG: gamma-glutamyltransferase [Gammaproteobacteria bacterium]|nr:gamma-glutamyltransferase [Gammaproteobacteria bacterium]
MNRILGLIFLLFLVGACAQSDTPPAAAVATAHPTATEAGHRIMAAGGNAFDAAVAVSATLAVVEPYSSGIGGGGFWLLHRADDGQQLMIDGRETAPLAAHRDMYLDEQGKVVDGLSIDGPLAAGIPGVPAALVHLSERYGKLTLKQSLAPAIEAAREGFVVTEHYRRMTGFRLEALRRSADAAAIFLHENEVPPLGHIIKQSDLARTLEAMAEHGRAGFYQGPVAKALVEGVRAEDGIWQLEDLDQYKVVEREPITGRYHDFKLISASPPSSGGIALAEMLNILEGNELDKLDSVTRKHLIVEAMRRAYRDRAEYLGDTDFVDVPVAKLTDKAYARQLTDTILRDEATPSASLKPVAVEDEGPHTTHFSILDKAGNRVSATLSINYPFGACFVPPGTGVLLNDEMDDFSSKPGVPNAYGLVGAEANAIAPGKRPLSSMSPTFVEGPDGVAILGTPGGSRIITMVLLGLLDYTEGGEPESWVSVGRYHHQYLPDAIQHEPGALSEEEKTQLQLMGHQLKEISYRYGNMQAILWDKKGKRVLAASDPRVEGKAEVRE